MKKWNKPEITELDIAFTEGGGGGIAADGSLFNVQGYILMGTSGDLELPPEIFVPI